MAPFENVKTNSTSLIAAENMQAYVDRPGPSGAMGPDVEHVPDKSSDCAEMLLMSLGVPVNQPTLSRTDVELVCFAAR